MRRSDKAGHIAADRGDERADKQDEDKSHRDQRDGYACQRTAVDEVDEQEGDRDQRGAGDERDDADGDVALLERQPLAATAAGAGSRPQSGQAWWRARGCMYG